MKLPLFLTVVPSVLLLLLSCKNTPEDQKKEVREDPYPTEQSTTPKESDLEEVPQLQQAPKKSKTEEAIQKKKKQSALDTLKPKTA